MKKLVTLLACLPMLLVAQQRINSSFTFQSQTKLYSIYVPSSYSASTPSKLMLGLHPFNTSRWNATSWCDTLIDFAEANDLLVICPDGGADGKVDDPIDTAFTSAILDSMLVWYNVDTAKTYAMGFSWGGLTTYTYGLNHASRFGGFMPIGAAIGGSGPISGVSNNARRKPFYVIHGANDSPNTRYYPLINELTAKNAILNTILMPGVGHTIDFPNRNTILGNAFTWIDSVNCFQIDSTVVFNDSLGVFNDSVMVYNDSVKAYNDSIAALDVLLYPIPLSKDLEVYPNPAASNQKLSLSVKGIKNEEYTLIWMDSSGKIGKTETIHFNRKGKAEINTQGRVPGNYLIRLEGSQNSYVAKVLIQ